MAAPSLVNKASVNGTIAPPEHPYERERGIHLDLENIRKGEISGGRRRHKPSLLQTLLFKLPPFKATILYIQLVISEFGHYFTWLGATWTTTYNDISKGHPLVDPVSYLCFALLGTLVLPFMLISCLVARFPPLTRVYFAWSKLFGGGLGVVNSANGNLFKVLTMKQVDAAKSELQRTFGEPEPDLNPEVPGVPENARVFNYDIAKLLLQIAAVIYEHDGTEVRNAAFAGVESFLNKHFEFLEATGDAFIRTFSRQFKIEYHPISDLENKSSAVGGLFWDPDKSWIIVALKGTGPVEFGECLSDLDSTMIECKDIPDFNMVHKGFKERVFPNTEGEEQGPYDKISKSVKTLANHLHSRHPDRKVNVWFTGHSLMRCATASLIYARMLMKPEEIGEHAVLRDAYLFAAPIICDAESVKTFNDKMFAGTPDRTMWRITSNDDYVATGLPAFGDYQHLFDPKGLKEAPKNNFFYAHLGTEIILYDHPFPSTVAGNHINRGHPVVIHSYNFTPEEIYNSYKKQSSKLGETIREKIGVLVQQIPIFGRFIAHSTVYYWDQLDRAAMGECEWAVY